MGRCDVERANVNGYDSDKLFACAFLFLGWNTVVGQVFCDPIPRATASGFAVRSRMHELEVVDNDEMLGDGDVT